MSCTVLTKDRWQRLLDGRLTGIERCDILQHLKKADCTDCEEFLSDMDATEELSLLNLFDSTVAVTQGSERSGSANQTHRVGNHRSSFLNRLFGGGLFFRSTSFTWAGGIAVLLIVTVVMLPSMYMDPSEIVQTHKMDQRTEILNAEIDIRFAIGSHVDGELDVVSGINGNSYSSSDVVFLNYRIPRDGYVYLLSYKDNQEFEVLYPDQASINRIQKSGEHTLRLDNKVTGFPLTGINGEYYIVGIYSPVVLDLSRDVIPLAKQTVIQPITTNDPDKDNTADDGIAVDVVYFDVHA